MILMVACLEKKDRKEKNTILVLNETTTMMSGRAAI
jgi:hypothetical protein